MQVYITVQRAACCIWFGRWEFGELRAAAAAAAAVCCAACQKLCSALHRLLNSASFFCVARGRQDVCILRFRLMAEMRNTRMKTKDEVFRSLPPTNWIPAGGRSRRESTGGERARTTKTKARTAAGSGEGSLPCDPRSDLRLGGQ